MPGVAKSRVHGDERLLVVLTLRVNKTRLSLWAGVSSHAAAAVNSLAQRGHSYCEMALREELSARGCTFTDERLVVVLAFLADQELECVADFVGKQLWVGWRQMLTEPIAAQAPLHSPPWIGRVCYSKARSIFYKRPGARLGGGAKCSCGARHAHVQVGADATCAYRRKHKRVEENVRDEGLPPPMPECKWRSGLCYALGRLGLRAGAWGGSGV